MVPVLDETAVVLEPVWIAVSAASTETLVVAAVVSSPAVWVHHVWSVHRDRLLQILINISRISRSAGDAIRCCYFAHLIAVARCDTQTFPPSIPMTRAGPSHCLYA